MTACLRWIGILNAAIWFGSGFFFAVVVLPGVFSHPMEQLFGPAGYKYYSGAVAMNLFRRYFILQYICGGVALARVIAGKICLGVPLKRAATITVVVILALVLLGGLIFQPYLEHLRHEMYFSARVDVRENCRRAFGMWHGISELINLFVLLGIASHLIHCCRNVAAAGSRIVYNVPEL